MYSILALLYFSASVEGAKILGIFAYPSLSHQIVYQPIWRELSLRGHQVTVVTPNPLDDKTLVNLTEIDVSDINEKLKPSDSLEKTMAKDSPLPEIMRGFYETSEKIQEGIMANAEFRKLYSDPSSEFDLVMTECLHPGMYSLAGRYNAPAIGVSSLGVVVATHESVGNPIHPVLYPDMNFHIHDGLTLKDKIHSTYFSLWLLYFYNYRVLPNADRIARKYLGSDLPYLGDIGRNVSLIFVNTNPLVYNVRPNIPSVITLGQMHITKPKPLSKDLQDILDKAKNGVVYFSLGSNVKLSSLSKNNMENIIGAISDLPYTVFLKVESENSFTLPKNVITRKWFPQQDLLAHPNIKVFVTQGGLQSLEEALSRGVPMVVMPFIGDQAMNAKKIVKSGIGLELDPLSLSRKELVKAIVEVAENEKYRQKIVKLGKLLEDQPMTGLEKAVWWTEYVIRHKGARFLHSPTADISWYEYFLLDVIAGVFFLEWNSTDIDLEVFGMSVLFALN
ncbi:hypothetical protein JTB14_031731 [Gonioctena quinquepunctata]|nr:hypothetical protein JTB14_031731 [Gonioctena quinquepunctata]